jgi:spermidine synthase
MVQGETGARLNTDLNPVSYYHQTRIWLDQLSSTLARPLQLLSPIDVWWAAIPIGLAAAVVAVTRGRIGRLAGAAVLIAAGAIGGFGLLVEVLALLAFQSACGYLYHALGALIAAFMAGLAIGSALVSRREVDRRHSARIMLAGLGAAALVCVVLPGLLAAVLQAPSLAPIALSLVLFLVGSMVGGLFPVATTLYRGERSASRAGGAVYAADLVGSAGGALAAGVIAIPLLGAAGASYAGALLLAAAFVLGLTLLRK